MTWPTRRTRDVGHDRHFCPPLSIRRGIGCHGYLRDSEDRLSLKHLMAPRATWRRIREPHVDGALRAEPHPVVGTEIHSLCPIFGSAGCASLSRRHVPSIRSLHLCIDSTRSVAKLCFSGEQEPCQRPHGPNGTFVLSLLVSTYDPDAVKWRWMPLGR